MVQVVNPFKRTEEDFITEANACNCICNSAADNNSSGIWTSRLTFNHLCGCACSSSKQNKSANDKADKIR